jgi:hypothetical protein
MGKGDKTVHPMEAFRKKERAKDKAKKKAAKPPPGKHASSSSSHSDPSKFSAQDITKLKDQLIGILPISFTL